MLGSPLVWYSTSSSGYEFKGSESARRRAMKIIPSQAEGMLGEGVTVICMKRKRGDSGYQVNSYRWLQGRVNLDYPISATSIYAV